MASRGQLWQSSGSSWEVLGELGRVFFFQKINTRRAPRTGKPCLPNLREFVLNSRHPDPRRVWKGGSEPRLMPPLPGDLTGKSGSAGSADEFQIVHFPSFLQYLVIFVTSRNSWQPLGSSGRLWGSLGGLWVSSGRLWRSSGRPLGSFGKVWMSSGCHFWLDKKPLRA